MFVKSLALVGLSALVLGTATVASGSAVDVTGDYLIGYWGMGTPEECDDRDTLAFYVTGVFAVTNGGGNPVEALGIWKIEGDTLSLNFTELDEPRYVESIEAVIANGLADQFTLTTPQLPNGEQTLHRCAY